MKTVAQLHAEWASIVTPRDAPLVQKIEMERAFYAGYFSCLEQQTTVLPELSDDDGVEAIQKQLDECTAYFRKLSGA